MTIKKSEITALTRKKFEDIVYNGMLSDDESKVLELWIRNKSRSETAEIMGYADEKPVERLRKSIRRKISKIY